MTCYVELNGVTKRFSVDNSATEDLVSAIKNSNIKKKNSKDKIAVNNVTLKINEGECLGIIGRNGAGKSTLLQMIAGITEPSSGTIDINGKVTSILTLGIGLREELSGRENIYVDGEIQGRSRAETDKIIDDVIAFADIGKFIDYPVRTYSTGMKSRLAFSMISLINPEILIIDEALTAGDASFAIKATNRIKKIIKKGKIVIIVSHGMSSIRDICNRCIYLKDGSIKMDGAPDKVTKSYVDEIKKEEETVLMAQFASHIGSHSFQQGYLIENPVIFTGDSLFETIRVEAKKKLVIQIGAKFPINTADLLCRVQIIRLDETILFQQDFNTIDYFGFSSNHCLELEFSYLYFAPAVYKINVELRENAKVDAFIYAKSSSIFEVYSLLPPTGGKPMLYYPVSIKKN